MSDLEKLKEVEKKEVSILDLFKEEEIVETGSGNYKTVCPDCGPQGGRTAGFILFPENNMAYCHSSQKSFSFLETFALQNKIISCMEGREKGDNSSVLKGELFTETLDTLKDIKGEEFYEEVLSILKLRKRIELPNDGKLISEFATELSERFSKEKILFYKSNIRDIVEITKIKNPSGDETYEGFATVKSNRFITLTERYFIPWYSKRLFNGDALEIKKSMSQSVANITLASDNFRDKMPVIQRLFTFQLPVIYNGELTFPRPGYDKRFGSWTPYNAPKIANPEMSLEEAKKILRFIYGEFCFQKEQDSINSIAAILTPFIQGLYDDPNPFSVRDPFFVYKANRERAGKDFCANITGILYEGVALEEPPISNNETKTSGSNDELRKKVLAGMLQGRKRLHFSNNKGLINNAVLEGVLTSRKYSDRLLGKNDIVSLDNEISYSMSGNMGIKLTPDLANRSIFINLFLDIEDANSRKFNNPNLHKWVYDNREQILSALYSLVVNWFEKGCPSGSVPFASFPEWARVCGGILEAAGIGNPCIPDKENSGVSMDSETEDMKSLFELCYEKAPDKAITKKEIRDIIENEEVFTWIDWDKKSDQTKFGVKLNKFVGRILSDIKLKVEDNTIRTTRWKYIFSKEKADFDKKSTFWGDFDKKDGHLGYLGHLLHTPENLLYIEKNKYRQKVANVTKVAIPSNLGKGQIVTKDTKVTKKQSDRQIQFYEAEECSDIKPNHTKEDILEFFQDNPDADFKQLYEKFGVGCLKFRNELKQEGKIK